MMRYAKIMKNDIVDGEGVCVSVWFQGCPIRCPGCHNPDTWDFDGGYEIDEQVLIDTVINSINENGVMRNLSLLGGEPLCEGNIVTATKLLSLAKQKYPEIKTFVWTGYTYEVLKQKYSQNIFDNIDYLIEGPFVLAQRDITLKWRGSTNQHIRNMKTGQIED